MHRNSVDPRKVKFQPQSDENLEPFGQVDDLNLEIDFDEIEYLTTTKKLEASNEGPKQKKQSRKVSATFELDGRGSFTPMMTGTRKQQKDVQQEAADKRANGRVPAFLLGPQEEAKHQTPVASASPLMMHSSQSDQKKFKGVQKPKATEEKPLTPAEYIETIESVARELADIMEKRAKRKQILGV